MKRLSLVLTALGAAITVAAGTADASGYENQDSGSCSGTVDGWGSFYAFTFQFIALANGEIENENHNFNFSGFLDDAEDARLWKQERNWIHYQAGNLDIDVPFVPGAGLFVRDNRDVDSGWIRLCDY